MSRLTVKPTRRHAGRSDPIDRNVPLFLREFMRRFIYRAHIWLGIIVAVPVLAWASSGLFYAWPNAVEGGEIQSIETARVRITAPEAMKRANEFAGRELPTTALTLLMREGRPFYHAVGGLG